MFGGYNYFLSSKFQVIFPVHYLLFTSVKDDMFVYVFILGAGRKEWNHSLKSKYLQYDTCTHIHTHAYTHVHTHTQKDYVILYSHSGSSA